MTKGEIITCQIGHYANYVGTHFWNLQEASFSYDPKQPSEFNHDVLFREGRTRQDVVTYVPRLVSLDLKGSLGTLKRDGDLYTSRDRSYHPQWPGKLEVHKSQPTPKNELLVSMDNNETGSSRISIDDEDKDICQEPSTSRDEISAASSTTTFQLDDKIKVWSDFLCMHLHPRSINLLSEYTHQNEIDTFEVFHSGQQLTASESGFNDIESSIRYFAEDCDYLQGFHLLLDADNGFTGVAANVLSYLGDEYDSKCTLSVPLYDFSTKKSTLQTKQCTIVNSMLCFDRVSCRSSLSLPMSCFTDIWKQPVSLRRFPHVNYQPSLPYHTSAILAAALDCATASYRLKADSSSIGDFGNALNAYGRKLASMSVEFPMPLFEGASLVDSFRRLEIDHQPISLTPSFDMPTNTGSMFQAVTLRGLPLDIKINPSKLSPNLKDSTHKLETFEELLNWTINKLLPSSFSPVCRISQPCNVCDPFPHIFDPKLSQYGIISTTDRLPNPGVTKIPMMTAVHSSDGLHDTLDALVAAGSALNPKKLHQFQDAGLEEDELLNCLENLKQLSSCYAYTPTV